MPEVHGFVGVDSTPALRVLTVKLTSVFLFSTEGDNCAQTENTLNA
jgi:hypothetical protein